MATGWLGRAPILWLALGFEGGLGIVAWFVGWWIGQPPLETLRWNERDALAGILSSAPMLLGFAACVRWPVGPLARIQRISDDVIRPLFIDCNILELILIALAAGIGEEMLFRGLIQKVLTDWWGPIWGVLGVGVAFGLMHLITPTYAVLAAALGIYLSLVWLADGNLLSVIIAHAFYDAIALIYLVKTVPPTHVDEEEEEASNGSSL